MKRKNCYLPNNNHKKGNPKLVLVVINLVPFGSLSINLLAIQKSFSLPNIGLIDFSSDIA